MKLSHVFVSHIALLVTTSFLDVLFLCNAPKTVATIVDINKACRAPPTRQCSVPRELAGITVPIRHAPKHAVCQRMTQTMICKHAQPSSIWKKAKEDGGITRRATSTTESFCFVYITECLCILGVLTAWSTSSNVSRVGCSVFGPSGFFGNGCRSLMVNWGMCRPRIDNRTEGCTSQRFSINWNQECAEREMRMFC